MITQNKAPEKVGVTKVLLVDDHPIVRQGIKMVLEQEPDFSICGEASSASEALQVLMGAKPDVAIVDLTLKESSGLELIKDIKIRQPKLLVLVLSIRDESFYAERALRAGARGYITKEEGTEKVVEGLRKILSGELYLSERISSKMIRKLVDSKTSENESLIHNLTDRELEILELIGAGLTTREVSERLHISIKTVNSHREHIKDKLKLDNSTELLKHAIQWVQYQGW